MNNRYRIGIIGYGGFGKFLHYWWAKLENLEVVAVADPSLKEQVEGLKTYQNWKDLVKDPDVDIISIVTPPALHAEMACAAMKAGKHVLLEKPIAITNEEAQHIIDTRNETGMVITVDHMIRYNPIIQSLMQLGKTGAFGKLRHVVVNNYAQDAGLPVDHWFWKEKLSGGILVEHGVHFFDIVNALSNQKYREVYGCSASRNEIQRDRLAAMVLYDEGLIASYYHAFSGPGLFEQTTIELAFDLARIEIEGWMPMNGRIKALVNEQSKQQLENIPGWELSSSNSLEELADVSRPEGWGESPADPADNHQVICGGVAYKVDELVKGTFSINQTKGQVYGGCVQSIITDLIHRVENKEHQLTITIEDAFEALQIAILASK